MIHTIRLTDKQHAFLLDLLIEARLVAKQVADVRPTQKKEMTKRAKDIQLVINKVKGKAAVIEADDNGEEHD